MKLNKESPDTSATLEATTYDTFPVKHELPTPNKAVPIIILVLTCIGSFCETFCYENPTPFQTQIEESLGLSTTKYNMLFSFYYLPNVFMPLLLGYLADVCGRRIAISLSAVLILLGQLLFAAGITTRSFALSIIGRLLFGIGAEGYIVVVLECLSFWTFSFIAISMGIQCAAQRLGSTVNDFTLPYVYEATGNLPLQFWIGFVLACVCLLATLALVGIEWYSLRDHVQEQGEAIELSAISRFPLIYWILIFFISFVYMGMISFNTIASGLLQSRFGFSVSASGVVLCIPLVIVIAGSVIFGFLIDRIGRYSSCCLVGSIGLTFSFAILSLLPDYSPSWAIYLCFAMYGGFCSLVIAAVWPCIKLVVPQGLTSTAYGLCFSVQDAMLFLGPFVTGLTIDATKQHSGGYFWASLLFFTMCFVSTVLGVFLLGIDYRGNRVLHSKSQPELPIPSESVVA